MLSEEPPLKGNALLDADLPETLPNLIVTPHNAWASHDAMQTLADQLVDNLAAFVSGEPRNLVTRPASKNLESQGPLRQEPQ